MDVIYKFFEHCWALFLVFLAGKLFGFLNWPWWWVFAPLISFVVLTGLTFLLSFSLWKKGEKKKAATLKDAESEFLDKMAEALKKDKGMTDVQAKMVANQFASAMKRNTGQK